MSVERSVAQCALDARQRAPVQIVVERIEAHARHPMHEIVRTANVLDDHFQNGMQIGLNLSASVELPCHPLSFDIRV